MNGPLFNGIKESPEICDQVGVPVQPLACRGDNRTDTNRSIRTCIDIGHIRIETDIVERARFIRRGIVIRGKITSVTFDKTVCPVGWQGRSYRCPGSAGPAGAGLQSVIGVQTECQPLF